MSIEKRILVLSVFLGLAVSLNLYFRTFTVNFPQFLHYAKNAVEESIRRGVSLEINRRFAQYDPLAKERLIKTTVGEYKRQNKKNVKKQIYLLYNKLKDRYQDENGQTYLMELDCWHLARYVDDVTQHGFPGDEIVDGKKKDNLMLAPNGSFLLWDDFLLYFSAFLYNVFSFFKRMPLFAFLFYLPLLFIIFFVVALFLFTYKNTGPLGAYISCLVVGLAPIFIPRSCAGWFDKDILNLFFPIMVVWTYPMIYETDTFKKRLIWLMLASFLVGLFCFTWTQWWFIFLIIILYELCSCAGNLLSFQWKKDKDRLPSFKRHFICLVVFIIVSIFWVLIFSGSRPLIFLYNQVRDAIVLSKPLVASIWPNVYSTVGELRRVQMNEIVRSVGGPLIFIPSFFCMIIISIRNLSSQVYRGYRRSSTIILIIWFITMFFACLQGIRFVMFLTVPLGIFLGWLLNDLYYYFNSINIRRIRYEGLIMVGVISIALSMGILNKANNVAKGIFPLMDDTWYKVLNIVKNNTPKNAILNSWWDFGDWYKVVSRRRVIFDGQSQEGPQARWMGRVILSQDEKEAIGILRMLNNGGNKAFEVMNEYIKEPLKTVLLLESLLVLEPEEAKERLREFLPEEGIQKVMKLLFDKPDPAYFIVEYTMLSKMPAISYLGNWNFSKVYMVQNFNKKEKDIIIDYLVSLGKDNQEVRRLYQEVFLIPDKELEKWISRPVQFYSGIIYGKKKGDRIFFQNGFVYDLKRQAVYDNNGRIPRSLFVVINKRLIEVVYPNANLPFSILVIKDKVEEKTRYRAVLLDRDLGKSIFVRLYFLKGLGLKHFKSHVEVEEGDNFIGVYKIVW